MVDFGVRGYRLSYVTHSVYVRRSVLSDKINGTYRKSRPLYYTHTQSPRYYICNFRCTLGQPPTMHARARARARRRRRRRRRFFFIGRAQALKSSRPTTVLPM